MLDQRKQPGVMDEFFWDLLIKQLSLKAKIVKCVKELLKSDLSTYQFKKKLIIFPQRPFKKT